MSSKELIESLKLKLNQLKSVTKINTHLRTIENKLNTNSSKDLFLSLNFFKISEKQLISTNVEKSLKPRKIFKCLWQNCLFKSAFKQNLNRHKSHHLNERQFVCDFVDCNKKFNFKGDLLQHKRTHFDEKTFKCDFKDCNKEFKSRSGLHLHKTTHFQGKGVQM